MNDIVQTLRSALQKEKHLDPPALSLYLNFYNNLSEVEKHFVMTHLESCPSCLALYEEVFDEELELDPSKQTIELLYQSDHTHNGHVEWKFEDAGRRFSATIIRGEKSQIIFTQFPEIFKGQKARLLIGEQIYRLPALQAHQILAIDGKASVRHVSLTTVANAAGATHRFGLLIDSSWRRYLAAAAVIIALTGFASWFLTREDPAITKKTIQPDSTVVSIPEEKIVIPEKNILTPKQTLVLAENFIPNQTLESHIQRTYRSEIHLEKLMPANAETLSVPITFNWLSPEDAPVLTVSIVNNLNEKVWEQSADKLPLMCPKKLSPGLYYWIVKTDGEMVSIRKFFVK